MPVNNMVIIAAVVMFLVVLAIALQPVARKPCVGDCDEKLENLTPAQQPPQEPAVIPENPVAEQPESPPEENPPEPSPPEVPVAIPSNIIPSNVFYTAIGAQTEADYKAQGYVIIKYFYSPDCLVCYAPVDWEDVLNELASEMEDTIILAIFDTSKNRWAAETWASTATGVQQEPVIRMDGMSGGIPKYRLYYGMAINAMLDSPKETLSEEVCKYTDKC